MARERCADLSSLSVAMVQTRATSERGYTKRVSILLAVPAVFTLAAFFLVPLSGLVIESLTVPKLGLQNYWRALGNDLYLLILWRTLRLAALVTFLALLLGYPVALTMSRVSGPRAALLTICVLIPLWTAVLVRAYAWIVILQRKGLLNEALLGAGLIKEPLRMLYTEGAVILATVHVLLPFMILSVFSVLRTIPTDLNRAAANLGASGLATFRHVTWPLSLPGVYSGVLMVFILALGFYITPALLGGPETLLIATLIGQQTTEVLDWGLAGALSVTLLLITLTLVAVFGRLLRLESKV
jgi:mannopine transport system permease protein